MGGIVAGDSKVNGNVEDATDPVGHIRDKCSHTATQRHSTEPSPGLPLGGVVGVREVEPLYG